MIVDRLYNCKNPFQGNYPKVLVVCSAGLMRSPTTALILSKKPYNFNTRSAGLDQYNALILVNEILLEWADFIICMNKYQQKELKTLTKKKIINFDIPDCYEYRSKELIRLIKEKAKKLLK